MSEQGDHQDEQLSSSAEPADAPDVAPDVAIEQLRSPEEPGPEPGDGPDPPRKRTPARLVAATVLALGSGIVNLTSVMGGPALADRAAKVAKVFPLEFVHVSRFAAVLAGLGLVVLSINIWRRKKRAYLLALALAVLSVGVHLTKGLDYEEAIVSAALAVVLWTSRKLFTVRSSTPDLGRGF